MSTKTALICGISGQDGAYLARYLLHKGYQVFGTSRDAHSSSFANLVSLEIRDQVKVLSVALNDFRSVLQALVIAKPDEVYNLAGQSSVGLSFEQPVETLESITIGTLNILEAIRFTDRPIKLYNAGSSECFGDTAGEPATELTAFHPRSPYGVSKSAAFWEVSNYREAYNLYACSGILFNHESPLRPERFVTKKIISSACRIRDGGKEKLQLGNISIERDWGWAPEYVEAMWLMLQQPEPEDFVIATGYSYKLEKFIEHAFSYLDMDWTKYVTIDETLYRPTDIMFGKGDPTNAEKKLGWKAKYTMPNVVEMLIDAEMSKISK